jgi:hypothetical protein
VWAAGRWLAGVSTCTCMRMHALPSMSMHASPVSRMQCTTQCPPAGVPAFPLLLLLSCVITLEVVAVEVALLCLSVAASGRVTVTENHEPDRNSETFSHHRHATTSHGVLVHPPASEHPSTQDLQHPGARRLPRRASARGPARAQRDQTQDRQAARVRAAQPRQDRQGGRHTAGFRRGGDAPRCFLGGHACMHAPLHAALARTGRSRAA